eukprot:12505963-Alexandrium_andersonii.AAC.1
MVPVTADLANLARALAIRKTLSRVAARVGGLLRAQLGRVAGALAVTTEHRRRSGRNCAHAARVDRSEG